MALKDIDLAHFHGFQGPLVAFRRDAGAARGVDANFFFRIKGFQQHGVGNDADIRTYSHEDDAVVFRCFGDQIGAAEGRLFQDGGK